jgi:hypothetical protein
MQRSPNSRHVSNSRCEALVQRGEVIRSSKKQRRQNLLNHATIQDESWSRHASATPSWFTSIFQSQTFLLSPRNKVRHRICKQKFPDGNMSLAEQEPHAATRQLTRTGNCQLVLSAKFRHHRQMTFGPTAKNRPHNCRASLQADANAANKYYHFSSISDSFNYSQRMTDFTPISLIHEHKHN